MKENGQRRKYPNIEGRGQYNKLNPDHFDFGASMRKPEGESSFKRLIRQYKYNALRRGIEFNLSEEEISILTKGSCEYCGIEPSQIMHEKTANGAYIYNGIDRKDKDLGYSKENCVPCCKQCNKSKSDLSEKEWDDWIKRLLNKQK